MINDRHITKHTIDAGNHHGSIGGNVSDNNNAQAFAKNDIYPHDKNSEFKINKNTQKEENRTEKEKED